MMRLGQRGAAALGEGLRRACSSPAVPRNPFEAKGLQETERYSSGLRWLHWLMAGGALTCIGTVTTVQYGKQLSLTGKQKGDLMMIHKSTGVLMLLLVGPRIAMRLSSKVPGPLPGHALENVAATASHALMYVFMLVMPLTGVTMGYFGGKGLPFYGMQIPGRSSPSKEDKKLAGDAFKIHKKAGWYFKYFVPVHVGAAAQHTVRGHTIWQRINPLAK